MWKFHTLTAIAKVHLQKLVSSNRAWPLALNLLTVFVAFLKHFGHKVAMSSVFLLAAFAAFTKLPAVAAHFGVRKY